MNKNEFKIYNYKNEDVIPVYKPIGWTPLKAINELKRVRTKLKETPITYAGRLDPMAEGLLLLLKGYAIKEKQQYLDLPKTYHAKILFGISTDSYDILGLPELQNKKERISEADLNTAVNSLIGTQQIPLPPFSSKPVKGKPLFQWALEKKLDEIEIPTRTMEIYNAKINNFYDIQWLEIYNKITENINLVTGNFRQTEILNAWEKINVSLNSNQNFQIAEINFECASGTYIRSLALKIGEKLNSKAILFHLKRIKIGNFQSF